MGEQPPATQVKPGKQIKVHNPLSIRLLQPRGNVACEPLLSNSLENIVNIPCNIISASRVTIPILVAISPGKVVPLDSPTAQSALRDCANPDSFPLHDLRFRIIRLHRHATFAYPTPPPHPRNLGIRPYESDHSNRG